MVGLVDPSDIGLSKWDQAGLALSNFADAAAAMTNRPTGYAAQNLQMLQNLQRQLLATQQMKQQQAGIAAANNIATANAPQTVTSSQAGQPTPNAAADQSLVPGMQYASQVTIPGNVGSQVVGDNSDYAQAQMDTLRKGFPQQFAEGMIQRLTAPPTFHDLGKAGGVMIDASGNVVKSIPGSTSPTDTKLVNLIDTQNPKNPPKAYSEASAAALLTSQPGRYALAPEFKAGVDPSEKETFGEPQTVTNPGTGKQELVRFGNRGTVMPVTNYSPKATGQDFFASMPQGLTGDDAYNWVSQNIPGGNEIVAVAKKVAAGDLKLPPMGRPNAMGEKVNGLISIAEPGTNIGQRYATAQEYSQARPTGKAITAINTTLMHADKMMDAFDQLHNSSVPLWNTVTNAAGAAVGAGAPANFAIKRDAVAAEARKVFAGASGGGITELNEWKNDLPSNASPEQMQKSASALIDLLHGRLDPLVNSYNDTMGTNKTIEDWMTPQTRQVWTKLQGVAAGQPAAPAQRAQVAPAPASVGMPAPSAGNGVFIQNGWRYDAVTHAPLGPAK